MKKLLTLLAFVLVAFTGNAQSTQKGDVNGDGDVSVNDVAMIVNYILGNENSNFIIANADVNGDGEITIADVMGTVSTILGDNGGNGGDTSQAYLTCPDDHHPHWIDLGLPSGTKWRCCNEGASKPEDYGGYYKIEDASSAPSLVQIKELLNNCSYSWCSSGKVYGVSGGQFTGPNGGTIFLPATGHYWISWFEYVGWDGWYWSSTRGPVEEYTYFLIFDPYGADWYDDGGSAYCDGKLSVRPVR